MIVYKKLVVYKCWLYLSHCTVYPYRMWWRLAREKAHQGWQKLNIDVRSREGLRGETWRHVQKMMDDRLSFTDSSFTHHTKAFSGIAFEFYESHLPTWKNAMNFCTASSPYFSITHIPSYHSTTAPPTRQVAGNALGIAARSESVLNALTFEHCDIRVNRATKRNIQLLASWNKIALWDRIR